MIASIFKKSTPFNYIIFSVLIFIAFAIVNFIGANQIIDLHFICTKAAVLLFLSGTFFALNFIIKKNNLTKDSDYAFLFFLLFLLFFPSVLGNLKILFANLLILLALRRVYSIQTLKVVKEKIFDASFFICLASVFQFWSLLFMAVVFLAVFFYVARDYRNWFIPFVGLAVAVVLFVLYGLIIDRTIFINYTNSIVIDFDFMYFKNNFQNLALSIYTMIAVFFIVSLLLVLPNKALNKKAGYKQTIFTYLIAVLVYLFSANKSNDLLLFSFFPLAIIATSDIEHFPNYKRNTIILLVILLLALFTFFTQL